MTLRDKQEEEPDMHRLFMMARRSAFDDVLKIIDSIPGKMIDRHLLRGRIGRLRPIEIAGSDGRDRS